MTITNQNGGDEFPIMFHGNFENTLALNSFSTYVYIGLSLKTESHGRF